MHNVSSNGARCSFAFEAKKSPNDDMRVMSSISFSINCMIMCFDQAQNDDSRVKIATCLSILCGYASKALLSHRPRLGRCSSKISSLASTTLGCIITMNILSQDSTQDYSLQGIHWCVDALEVLVNFNSKASSFLTKCEILDDYYTTVDSILSSNDVKMVNSIMSGE